MDRLLVVVADTPPPDALLRPLAARPGWQVRVAADLLRAPLDHTHALLFLRPVRESEARLLARRPEGLPVLTTSLGPPVAAPCALLPPFLLHPSLLVLQAELARAGQATRGLEWTRAPGLDVETWLATEAPLLARWFQGFELVNVERLEEARARLFVRPVGGPPVAIELGEPLADGRAWRLRADLGERVLEAWSREGRDELIETSGGQMRRVELAEHTPWLFLARLVASWLGGQGRPLLDEAAWERAGDLAERVRQGLAPSQARRASLGEVVLVKPPRSRGSLDQVVLPPLGLARLRAALVPRGFRVRVVDLDVAFGGEGAGRWAPLRDDRRVAAWLAGGSDPTLDALADQGADALTLDADTAALGFSVTDVSDRLQPHFALLVGGQAKRRAPRPLPVVVGGDFEAIRADDLLAHPDRVDAVVFGDGERALGDWLQATWLKDRPLAAVEGLWIRAGDDLHRGRRARVPLAERPLPDFTGVPLGAYRRGPSPELRQVLARHEPERLAAGVDPLLYLPYFFVSGCAARCVFCSWGTHLDVQDPRKSVAELIELADRHQTDCFYLLDTTVNVSRRALEGLVEGLLASGRKLYWSDSARPHRLDDDLARGMAQAGCVMLSYGVESGSDAVLTRMRKGFTAEQAGRSLEAAHSAGILNRVNLIAGFFHESDADIAATEAFLDAHHHAIDVIGCFQGFYLFDGLGLDPDAVGIRLRGTHDVLPAGQATLTWDEPGGLTWEEKRAQIGASHARVSARLDALGVFRRDKIDDYDLFHLARLFPDKARRRRYLLESARMQEDRPPPGGSREGPR